LSSDNWLYSRNALRHISSAQLCTRGRTNFVLRQARKFPCKSASKFAKVYPDAYKVMLASIQAIERTGVAQQLIDLVNYRVSQHNGCTFCLDMHSKDLRALGETEQRLYMNTDSPAGLMMKRQSNDHASGHPVVADISSVRRNRYAGCVDDRVSMPRVLSQRANQKPSRPASKATATRSILRSAALRTSSAAHLLPLCFAQARQ
jgi:AhpD family alkylhydroperoxidase